jgi:perosamine synthetase
MENERIPVAGPWVTDLEVRYVAEAAANDWYGNAGQSVGRFERAFAEHVGVGHALAVPHCTSALHLSLLALGVSEGDEVIVPDITWVATAAPVYYVGAVPVFADVDPATWCVTAATLEACITERTRAIITVDLYGAVPDMDEIRAMADRRGIPIIEDAAEAIGATWKGAQAGSFGALGTFSFHGSKTLTTGEGGMLVTDDADHYARVSFLRDHGRAPGSHKYFLTTEVGYKYRMSSLQAAFGLAQLERIDDLITRKRDIFRWYAERLADVPGVQLNHELAGSTNTYWMVTAVVDPSYGLSTRGLMDALDEFAVESRPFFHPLSSLPAFASAPDCARAAAHNTVSYDISARAVNLPSALMLTEAQVDRACQALRTVLDRAGAA